MLQMLRAGMMVFMVTSALGRVAAEEQPYPIEYWAVREAIQSVQISPNGEKLALMKTESRDGNPIIEIYDIADLSAKPTRLAADPMEFTNVSWVSDNHLVMSARQKVRNKIEGYNRGVYEFRLAGYTLSSGTFNQYGENFGIASLLPDEPNFILIEQSRAIGTIQDDDPFAAFRPRAYYRLDLETGRKSLVLKGSEDFGAASFDRNGYPRFTQGFDAPENELIYYYRKPGDRSWNEFKRVPEEEVFTNTFEVAMFDSDDSSIAYVLANNGHDKVGLWSFDFDTLQFGELIYRRDDVDVLGVRRNSNFWGEPERIAGVFYPGLKYESDFFDEAELRLDEQLKASIPNAYSITIASMSKDGRRFTVYNSGPKDPGSYWLVTEGGLQKLGSRNPLLSPENLATVEKFWYDARDGRKVPGHITIPAHGEAPYPLVVMPHGGPYVNVIPVWDEWGQILANNGYMVFEPNYRGSTGYGVDHFMSSWDEHGRAMQDDKDDGALHLVEQGLVDPDRIAMFGWSYGGYAALVAAARERNIYQCAIAGAAVADPWMQYNYRRGEPGSYADRFGRQRATGIRPIEEIDNLNIPLLMIHGDVDQRVPFEHYRKFKRQVDKTDKDVQFVVLKGADHFSNTLYYEHQFDLYSNLIGYLKEDCGQGGL
ncbi:MAG: prolyl oligopeptidase family serine peptidase [Pseudomonadota bacterium]